MARKNLDSMKKIIENKFTIYRFEKLFFGRLFLLLFCSILFLGNNASAQENSKYIRDGNKEYAESHYADAQKDYEKALQKKADIAGAFNLGDAYYKQKQYKDAAAQFQSITSQKTDKATLAKAYHNLGNSLLQDKQYEESVKAYKNALINNPKDDDTRYNLAYAQEKLLEKQNKDKQNQKKKDDQKQDQKKQQQKQNPKNDPNKDKQNQDKKNQQNQPQKDQISKADAQRLLDAMNDDEKKLQEKLNKKKAPAEKADIQKNW